MGERPKNVRIIRQFPGMNSRTDPDDLQEGQAQLQLNLSSEQPGMLKTRSGFQKIQFEN